MSVALVCLSTAAVLGFILQHREDQNSSVLGISHQVSPDNSSSVPLEVTRKDVVPANGSQRVSVAVRVTNTTEAELLLSPGLQFWIEDASGNRYPYTAEYDDPTVASGGPVGAYQVSNLQLNFTVPMDSAPTELIFQQDASASLQKVGL